MTASVQERALQSLGSSSRPIYEMVRRLILARMDHQGSCKVLDVGCGTGNLYSFLADSVSDYEGVDVIRYEGFPATCRFHQLDLDSGRAELPDAYADFVVAVETIEHLENPRALMRELVRLCRPGGWVIVTTPNQLSFLSKLTFLLKNQFNAFTNTNYPAHITALLEIDLKRIAKECQLEQVTTDFSLCGRLPGTALKWPRSISRQCPRFLSDNIAVVGKKLGGQ